MISNKMKIDWTKMSAILTVLLALVGGAFATYTVIDARYAKAEDVIENRLEINALKLQNLADAAQREYYRWRETVRNHPEDQEAILELEEAKEEYKGLKTRLNNAKHKK